MRKLTQLKQFILNLPLNIPVDNLEVKASDGRVVFYRGQDNQNFALLYNIEILLLDFNQPLEQLVFYVIDWIKENSENYDFEDFTYQTDILSNDSYDLILKIKDIQEDFIYNPEQNRLDATTIDLNATDVFYQNKKGFLALQVKG